MENETFEEVKYFEWYNPVIQKYLNGELAEYELVAVVHHPRCLGKIKYDYIWTKTKLFSCKQLKRNFSAVKRAKLH